MESLFSSLPYFYLYSQQPLFSCPPLHIMARAALAKANLLPLRCAGGAVKCNFSGKAAAAAAVAGKSSGDAKGKESSSWWVPHRRTGIYVPRGSEWVIDDVPDHAASFSRTYWLRNVDGVEKADPDSPPDTYLIT